MTINEPRQEPDNPTADWPVDGLEKQMACPVCASVKREVVHAALVDRIFHCAPGKWPFWRCANCGCGYLDPRPTPATIGLAYSSYYTHESPHDAWLSSSTRLASHFPALRNAYLNARFPALRLAPALPFGGSLLKFFPSTRDLAERDVRHLPAPSPGARLLDIGCGSGSFVKRALALGYQAEGLEFDAVAVASATANGLPVSLGALPATNLASAAYDVVTLSQVIEHLHDPKAALLEIFRLLIPGGVFWLATPNMDAPGHHDFGPDWRGLEPPRHLVLFSPSSLVGALEAAGLVDIQFMPPGNVGEWFYRASERVRRRIPDGVPVKLTPELRRAARSSDRSARSDPRTGEELVVLARKPLVGVARP